MMRLGPLGRGAAASIATGAAAIALLTLGFGNLGGVVAFVHQCLVVGLPFALVLGPRVFRSARSIAALSFAFSMAISALTAQLLIMFELAEPIYLLASATLYGLVLAVVADAGLARATTTPAEPDPGSGDDTSRWRDTRELAMPRADDGTPKPPPPPLDTAERPLQSASDLQGPEPSEAAQGRRP